jgi:hypothetical protein
MGDMVRRGAPLTPSGGKALSRFVTVVSVAFLFLTIILPYLKFPQSATFSGPTTPYILSNTTLSGYFIPPVDKGNPIKITISNYSKGSVSLTVFPTAPGNIGPAGPVILEGTPIGTTFTASIDSPGTQPYGVYVVSQNRTNFTLRVDASWSPFFVLNQYIVPGVFLVIATTAAYYYYLQAERRWTTEQKVLRDAGGQSD